jgi:hypothetical protein
MRYGSSGRAAAAACTAKTGMFYLGGNNRVLRSGDFGATWSDAGAPTNQDGYMGLVGDGAFIYTTTANTGTSTVWPVRYGAPERGSS